MANIDDKLYSRLKYLGIIPTGLESHQAGASDYNKHTIPAWAIWLDYELNPWDADIVKRILRKKKDDPRALDYRKIIHICEERLRQLEYTDSE